MKQNNLIRIKLIGDIFPGELPYTLNYGIRTQFRRHKGSLWVEKLNEIFGINDIIIGNLESPLISSANTVKKIFYGDPEFAGFLKDCGINVLNIANNHILEQGDYGFKQTKELLEKSEIGVVGYETKSGTNIHYRYVKGMKIAIAGFSNVDLTVIDNKGSFSLLNDKHVCETIRRMQDNMADLKILSFHWGNEYIHIPSAEQRKLAYKFIDLGADVITGHHPHVIQPYEKYKDGHIFYSLGNFMFDYLFSKMVSIGLVSTLEIESKNKIHVRINGVKLTYKNTVSLMPDKLFNKYYSRILNHYANASSLSEKDYRLYYSRLLRKGHLKQRILMKISLIREFLVIRMEDKYNLSKNIFSYYLNLLTNKKC